MPGLNRRGPNGEGAMTGRRLGRCNPDNKGKTDDEINLLRASHPKQGLGQGSGQSGLGQGNGLGRRRGLRLRGNA